MPGLPYVAAGVAAEACGGVAGCVQMRVWIGSVCLDTLSGVYSKLCVDFSDEQGHTNGPCQVSQLGECAAHVGVRSGVEGTWTTEPGAVQHVLGSSL